MVAKVLFYDKDACIACIAMFDDSGGLYCDQDDEHIDNRRAGDALDAIRYIYDSLLNVGKDLIFNLDDYTAYVQAWKQVLDTAEKYPNAHIQVG